MDSRDLCRSLGRDEGHLDVERKRLERAGEVIVRRRKGADGSQAASVLLSRRDHRSLDGGPTGIERAAPDRSGTAGTLSRSFTQRWIAFRVGNGRDSGRNCQE
jgi:hypothetical protein